VGLVALIVIGAGTFLGFTKSIPFQSHYEIRAAFRTSNNVKKASPVRIAGVEVGKVVKVEPTAPGAESAFITMRINDNGRPIHADATAKIRPRIFLEGNFFVDLTPGTPSAPRLDHGDTIPASQTATPVQFDQVLKALKAPTRKDLQLTLGELADAYDNGLAESFRGSLDDQAPAFKFSAIVLEAMLGRRPHDLSGVVRDVGTVSAALDRSPPRLASFLENFNTFANSLYVERTALGQTIEELPRTLAAGSPALDSLNAAFPAVRRLAVAALPGVKSSGPTIAAVRPLVRQLRGLVGSSELRGLSRDLRAATPNLVGLANASVPLLQQFRQLSSCVNEVLIPWSSDTVPDPNFPASGPVFQTGVKWLPAVAGESRSMDANGQWFKVLGSGGVETFQLGQGFFGTSALPIAGVNPPKPKARPPLNADAPCENQQTPDLRTTPGAAPRKVAVDWKDPAVLDRYAKSRQSALTWMQSALDGAGVKGAVSDVDATLGSITDLARRNGLSKQLPYLKRSLEK
jgi:virulence factor Mce-like protein